MKKITLFFCFAFVSSKFFTQIEKGTVVPSLVMQITGANNQSAGATSGNKYSSVNFTISPGFGKFVRQNLLIRIEPTFSKSKSITEISYSSGINDRIENSDFGAGLRIGITKYKFISENFAFGISSSLSGSFSEGGNKTSTYYSNLISYHNSVTGGIQISGTINYFLTKNIMLSASMGFAGVNYQYSPYTLFKHYENHNVSFSFSPSFNNFGLGLSYFIRPKTQVN